MMGCKAVETSLSCLSRDSWCRWPTRLQGWSSSLAPVCVATDDIFSAYILHGWCLLSPSGDLVVKLVRDRPHQLCNVVLFIPFVQIIPSGQISIYVPNVTVIYLYLRWSCSHIRALFSFAAWPFLVCIGYDGRRDKHTWAMVPDKATSPKWEWVLRNMKVWWRSSGYCKAFAKAWFLGSLSWFWLGTQHTGKEDLKSGQRSCGNESFLGWFSVQIADNLQSAHK